MDATRHFRRPARVREKPLAETASRVPARQVRVLRPILEGHGNEIIADHLGLALVRVQEHVSPVLPARGGGLAGLEHLGPAPTTAHIRATAHPSGEALRGSDRAPARRARSRV